LPDPSAALDVLAAFDAGRFDSDSEE
jgi:hypothetical protein